MSSINLNNSKRQRRFEKKVTTRLGGPGNAVNIKIAMAKLHPDNVIHGTIVFTKKDYVLSLIKEITTFDCDDKTLSYYQIIEYSNRWTIAYVSGYTCTSITDYTDVSKQDVIDFFDKLEIDKTILLK